MLRMHYRKFKDGRASYAVSGFYRWVYGLFCLFIGLGFLSVLRDGGFTVASAIPVVLFLISLAGFGYRERWIFDPHEKTITYGFGIFFLFKSGTYTVADVLQVEINHFVRGRLPGDAEVRPRGRNKAMVVFSLRMKDDSTKDIEIIAERTSGGKSENTARLVADLMDLPFHADREPDTIQSVSVRDL